MAKGRLIMGLADYIAIVAAALSTTSFLPQALQVLRTRETRAISLVMYSMFTAGVGLWGVYGLITAQWTILIANGITLVLASTILSMKVRDVLAARRAAKVNA
jgi:MtN3 and saliva related transmembrane protein